MYTIHTHFTSDDREDAVQAGDLDAAVLHMEATRDTLLADDEWELLSESKRRMTVLFNQREGDWVIVTITRSDSVRGRLT